jgi:hypothetical protein
MLLVECALVFDLGGGGVGSAVDEEVDGAESTCSPARIVRL